MKKTILFVAFATIIALTGCNKEDNGVDIARIAGKWSLVNDDPLLAVDGSVTYTFYTNGRYRMVVYDALSVKEYIYEGTYVVSIGNNKIITLTDSNENDSSEQYFLLKLNSREMKWQKLVYGGEFPVERLVKLND